ncbi:MAG: type II secretory pathway component GspD/PulD (secretin) [Candidatus Deianiraeaceae bacterium]|jgi:type II secretory pathway component GspD/PulD (secretin)
MKIILPLTSIVLIFCAQLFVMASDGKQNDVYLRETQTDLKNSRHPKYPESDSKPLQHAQVDSALILDRYDNKSFIKQKIEHIAREIVHTPQKKKTIAEQMGKTGQKRVSVSIDENVDIKDAILEISNLAGVDVEVDPEVSGGVILSLKNAKVADVLERIAEMSELNISVNGGVIRFMANKPFTGNYSISFIDSANGNSSGGSVGNNNASSNNIPLPAGGNGGSVVNALNTKNSLQSSSSWSGNNSMWGEFEEGLRYIVAQKDGVDYSINKQAGVVTLRAPLTIHEEVEKYINKVKRLATAQILVEVRLVEVSLEDEYGSGIDFGYLSNKFNTSGIFQAAQIASTTQSAFVATLGKVGQGMRGAISFLQTFGTTKTIASPRLNVMNNQRAHLSFSEDYVYFSLQPQLQNQYTAPGVTPTNPNTPVIVNSVMQTVPIGVILDLQATADIDTNEITMNIHPVISSVTGTKEDPAASFLSAININNTPIGNVVNTVPIVKKKELDSTLRIKSGDIMVIGGFNEERTTIVRKGIPVLKDIPMLRFFFGSDQQYVKNVETVIFIKATIMGVDNPISEEDVKFYNDFA